MRAVMRGAFALDLAEPPSVDGAHVQHAVLQIDHGRASERGSDGKLPGEPRACLRRRLPPDDLRQHAGREVLDGEHGHPGPGRVQGVPDTIIAAAC
jgi:hypothetical protein